MSIKEILVPIIAVIAVLTFLLLIIWGSMGSNPNAKATLLVLLIISASLGLLLFGLYGFSDWLGLN